MDHSENQGTEAQAGLAQVVQNHRDSIMKLPGVVGIAGGLSRSDPATKCVLVYTQRGDWPQGLPKELDGYPVEVVDTGGGFRPR